MRSRNSRRILIATCLVIAAFLASTTLQAADADSAQMLARQSGCFKCHAIDHKKEAPAYRDVAAKYLGDPGAVEKLIHHITSGERVKFEDGHEEGHKVVKSKDPAAIKNLVEWILSLPGGSKQ